MLEYIIKRLALAVVTLFFIAVTSYVLLRLAPGDPTRSNVLGAESGATNLTSDRGDFAQNSALRERLHLDEPIYVGLFFWLKGVVLHGDFGTSAVVDPGRPVTDIILERLPVTVKLNLWSVIVIYLFAVPLGIYSAMYPDTLFDKGVTFVLFFLYSLPAIWVALLLQAGLCEGGYWSIFPLKGLFLGDATNSSTWQCLWQSIMHYIMPVACLSYAGFAGISRFTRSSMLDVINQDYIRTARAKGLPECVVILKHALRNGLITLITLFAGLLPGLIAGSIIVEHVFSISGMGSLSLLSLSSRDYPVQMALFCFAGVLTLIAILIADLCYVLVDPRISFADKK